MDRPGLIQCFTIVESKTIEPSQFERNADHILNF
jgi:hypothetical protein